MKTRTTFLRTLVVVAALVSLTSRVANGASADMHLSLKLYGALFQGDKPIVDGPSLLLELRKVGDRWERVIGTAGNFSRGIHVGTVTEAHITEQEVRLAINLNIYGDGYFRITGRGEYQVSLKRSSGAVFAGTFTGNFRALEHRTQAVPGQERAAYVGLLKEGAVTGRAEAALCPPLPPPRPGFQPVQPGEHPRILFRKTDLPALRDKAKTPFGQAALAKMTDAIGLGVKYQLAGDKQFAEEARAFVERLLDGDYSAVKAPGSHHGMLHYGPVWEQAAVAYDLCYDAWPIAFRKRVESWLMLWANRILYQHMMFNTQAQYNFGNSEAGWFYYAPALAGLALWGEQGPRPVAPPPPDPVTDLAPATDYQPGKGVPVLPLEPGKPPSQWLATAPLPFIVSGDPLQDFGGAAKCRPEHGTSFTVDGESCVFKPLAPEFIPPSGGVILNLGKSLQQAHLKKLPGPEMAKDGPITLCLFTVLRNDAPRRVKVHAPFSRWGAQQFVLAGRNLAHEQVVNLDKGLYPLLIVARVQARWNYLEPCLESATDADAAKSKMLLAYWQAENQSQMRDWQADVAEWKRNANANQEFQKLFEVTRWAMFTHYREGFGAGAAQSDTAGMCETLGLLPGTYATAYRNCFGVDASPYPDITHFIARRMFAHVYPADGQPVTQSVNGPNGLDHAYFAAHFPIVPDAWKPAVLWAWNRHVGVRGPEDFTKVLQGPIASLVTRAFLHYPLDLKPQPPHGLMPLAWEAPDYGYYGFRDAWKGQDDFLVQVYGRCLSGQGYRVPNAGNFTIMGLGHVWAESLPSLRLNNQRTFANVVLLTDDDINEDALGRLAYASTEADGSGVVTFDLNDIYAGAETDAKGRKADLYEKYGRVRRASAFKDSSIQGLRSFAVDYSGLSGAPCLFAVVDKITGGGPKVWAWRLDTGEVDKKTGKPTSAGDLQYAKVEGNVVTLARPDGTSMRLTFIAPAAATVKAEKREIIYTRTYNRGKGEMAAPGIYASGGDPKEGNYLAVATIQRGDAPPLKVEGEGLGATVTVGKRLLRFDGTKIVFSKIH